VNSDKPETPAQRDVALIHGRTADGEGLRILRQREQRLEVGEIRPLKEGRAIQGEVVSLKPRAEFPLLCDVSVEVAAPTRSAPPKSGPAQVATDSYRENWDTVFKRPSTALN
jgi:hypothetical protein